MPLLKDGALVEDAWTSCPDGTDLPEDKPAFVTLERWQTERDRLLGRNAPLGIRLKSDQSPEQLGPDLGRFQAIALEFPKFNDGRAFSYGRLLRERFGYTGEIRAVGPVIRDQYLLLKRCGFDTVEVKPGTDAGEWEAALGEFTNPYQPTGDGRPSIPSLRHKRA